MTHLFHFFQKIFLHIKFWFWVHSKKIRTAYALISRLYADIDSVALSKKDRAKKNIDSYEMVYGEIPFYTLALLLDIIHTKNENKNKMEGAFYDLGSGSGKAVITAALLYPFKKARGIELLPTLYESSFDQLKRLEQLSNQMELPDYFDSSRIQFIHGDFFEEDLSNCSEGDTVFINATGFFGESKERLIEKLREVKPECWIIITSKKLPEADFNLIDARVWPMSWGDSMIYLYQRH